MTNEVLGSGGLIALVHSENGNIADDGNVNFKVVDRGGYGKIVNGENECEYEVFGWVVASSNFFEKANMGLIFFAKLVKIRIWMLHLNLLN